MRIAVYAAVVLSLVASAAVAQQSPPAPSFGSSTCRQQIPCGDDSSVSADQWASYGNACLATAFGYTSPDGYFDDTAGLDNDNCLTIVPQAFANGKVVPRCCVINLTNGCAINCSFHMK